MKKIAIVLPTYNEAGSIDILINQIFLQQKKIEDWEIHILVVDSQSTDDTSEKIKKLQKKYSRLYLLLTKKEGLGKAYIKGFSYALEKLNPYVIFEMDADLSHDPESLPKFLKEIERGADFVLGSRYIKGGSIPLDWAPHRKIFSIIGNLIVRIGFMKLKISDWTSGFRAVKTWVFKSGFAHIKNYSGYVFQVAFLDQAIKFKARIAQVPIQFKERKYGVSKINAGQYIFQTLLYVFSHSSFIKFVIVGLFGFVIDFGLSFLLIEKFNQLVWLSTLISTETAIISNFFLNNFWSFSYKKLEHNLNAYLISFLKFNLVSSGSILIQTLGIQLLVLLFGRKFWYIYKILIIAFIIIPYSYILYNKIIWRDKNPNN